MGNLMYIVGIICAVWVLYDVWAVNRTLTDTGKIVWSILAVLLSILTAIIYYFMVKKK